MRSRGSQTAHLTRASDSEKGPDPEPSYCVDQQVRKIDRACIGVLIDSGVTGLPRRVTPARAGRTLAGKTADRPTARPVARPCPRRNEVWWAATLPAGRGEPAEKETNPGPNMLQRSVRPDSPRDGLCALCWVPTFLHYGLVLMLQKNPESKSVGDQQ